MLKVLKAGERYPEPCALLLGGFDGFHLGHRRLLEAEKKTGLPVGVTLLAGNKAGGNIFTLSEREKIFDSAGFAFALEYSFTEELKNTSAEDFLSGLFSRINAKAVFCGEDYRFGKGALGTVEMLKRLAPCEVNVLPIVSVGGKKAAASHVKELLSAGKVEEANRLLCHRYFFSGTVEHGRQVGRTYGFPTLNLSFAQEKLPLADGVYGGFAETPAGVFPSIIHFGARPTFGVEEKKAEAYLKGFHGDLYGAEVRIYPAEYLRPVKKFSSKEELKNQLKKDIEKI